MAMLCRRRAELHNPRQPVTNSSAHVMPATAQALICARQASSVHTAHSPYWRAFSSVPPLNWVMKSAPRSNMPAAKNIVTT